MPDVTLTSFSPSKIFPNPGSARFYRYALVSLVISLSLFALVIFKPFQESAIWDSTLIAFLGIVTLAGFGAFIAIARDTKHNHYKPNLRSVLAVGNHGALTINVKPRKVHPDLGPDSDIIQNTKANEIAKETVRNATTTLTDF